MGLKKKPVLLVAADAAAKKKKEEGKWGVKVKEVKDILDDTISTVSDAAKDTITTLLDDDLDEEDFCSDDESMISCDDDESVISRHSASSRNSLNKSARDRIAQARPLPMEKKEDRKQQQKNKRNNGKFNRMKRKEGRRRFRFFGQRSKKNRNKSTRRALETAADETQIEDDTMWIDSIADKFGCLCGNFDDAYSYDDDTASFDSYSYGSEDGNFIP